MPNAFNEKVIAEFRSNNGVVRRHCRVQQRPQITILSS